MNMNKIYSWMKERKAVTKGIANRFGKLTMRVLDSGVGDAVKEELKRQYSRLNPAELHREIVRLQNKLIEMVTRKKK